MTYRDDKVIPGILLWMRWGLSRDTSIYLKLALSISKKALWTSALSSLEREIAMTSKQAPRKSRRARRTSKVRALPLGTPLAPWPESPFTALLLDGDVKKTLNLNPEAHPRS